MAKDVERVAEFGQAMLTCSPCFKVHLSRTGMNIGGGASAVALRTLSTLSSKNSRSETASMLSVVETHRRIAGGARGWRSRKFLRCRKF